MASSRRGDSRPARTVSRPRIEAFCPHRRVISVQQLPHCKPNGRTADIGEQLTPPAAHRSGAGPRLDFGHSREQVRTHGSLEVPAEHIESFGWRFCQRSRPVLGLVLLGSWAPSRHADRDGVVYQDIGVIFHAPLSCVLSNDEHAYGSVARRLVWVAALQRLANGVGVRLLRDGNFREAHLNTYDFEEDAVQGALFFRVVIRANEYGSVIECIDVLKNVIERVDGRTKRD